jgi:hypothetical protein
MKQLGKFTLNLGSKKQMPVEVLVDGENTIILIDCTCCEEYLSRRLPGGVLILIASALKKYFKAHNMRNIDVNVSDLQMRRTYKGLIDESNLQEITEILEQAVIKFTKKRKKK